MRRQVHYRNETKRETTGLALPKETDRKRLSSASGFSDTYAEDRLPGRVIGTQTAEGILRRGVDVEGVISIDNGALRIQPLIEPGWGRAGIAYGPYRRQEGLAFAVFLVNGHNTSQSEQLPESFRQRLLRWWLGSETWSRSKRILQWLISKRKRRMVRRIQWWWRLGNRSTPVPEVNENLAVGWFSRQVPEHPLADGNAFVMHATGPENGELWATVGGKPLPAIRGVQNLQAYYVVVLRERGAAYYASSIPNTKGFGVYPELRPLAVDPFNEQSTLYAALYQSVLGQIGFRLDTRVYGARVALVPELAMWYGTAHAADSLAGDGALDATDAEIGGRWRQHRGVFARTADGARSFRLDDLALLQPRAPSGLIHVVVVSPGLATANIGLIWRARDDNNFWQVMIGESECELSIIQNGMHSGVATAATPCLAASKHHSLQIVDDGFRFSVHLDGQLLFDTRFANDRLQAETGVGFRALGCNDGLRIRYFEAHPRGYPLPVALDLGKPWWRFGDSVVLSEDFEGPTRDLDGKTVTSGGTVWNRTIGTGRIDVTGNGSARVRATSQHPNPGRTGYTIDWDCREFADLEVTITPPGSERGQREHGRSGFVFWQDADNYVVMNIWLNDSYGGASVSTFFHLDGFEDLYDAIWSNVGDRVFWGRPFRFRATFDGMRYNVFLDSEPVLYRGLTDVYADCTQLSINRVGLIANWEWGNDTGSVFREFRARA